MNKKNADKILAIRIPTPMFKIFKEKCNNNFKSMSDTLRDYIRDYIKKEDN